MDQKISRWAFKGDEDRGWEGYATTREKWIRNISMEREITRKPPNIHTSQEWISNKVSYERTFKNSSQGSGINNDRYQGKILDVIIASTGETYYKNISWKQTIWCNRFSKTTTWIIAMWRNLRLQSFSGCCNWLCWTENFSRNRKRKVKHTVCCLHDVFQEQLIWSYWQIK